MNTPRKLSKPDRDSRSLTTVKARAETHKWGAMITFKPPGSVDEESSNKLQRYLVGLLRRELRKEKISFLLVREFGSKTTVSESPDRSHFHVVIEREMSDLVLDSIRQCFLKRCKMKDNKSRIFQYTVHTREGESKFGEYVSKIHKGPVDVIHPPASWSWKKLIRLYHYGYFPN